MNTFFTRQGSTQQTMKLIKKTLSTVMGVQFKKYILFYLKIIVKKKEKQIIFFIMHVHLQTNNINRNLFQSQ